METPKLTRKKRKYTRRPKTVMNTEPKVSNLQEKAFLAILQGFASSGVLNRGVVKDAKEAQSILTHAAGLSVVATAEFKKLNPKVVDSVVPTVTV